MCCIGFRSTQILIGSGKSRRAETETIEVHLRWCPRARFEETPCRRIKTHGLPSEARPEGRAKDGEPKCRELEPDWQLVASVGGASERGRLTLRAKDATSQARLTVPRRKRTPRPTRSHRQSTIPDAPPNTVAPVRPRRHSDGDGSVRGVPQLAAFSRRLEDLADHVDGDFVDFRWLIADRDAPGPTT